MSGGEGAKARGEGKAAERDKGDLEGEQVEQEEMEAGWAGLGSLEAESGPAVDMDGRER